MSDRRKRKRVRGKLRVKDNNQIAVRDWEGLPQGLLEVVVERLPLGDWLSFSKVCKSWRVIVAELLHGRTCGIPWLVKHGGIDQKDSITRSCISIVQDLGFEIELPQAFGHYIWGSFQDWLVLVKPCIEICLLNPFSGTKILLPKTFDLYRMMVLSAVPSDEDYVCALVGAHSGRFAFWTPGAPEWLDLDLFCRMFEDVMSYDGRFYFVNRDFSLGIIDVENVRSTLRGKKVAAEIKIQELPVKMPPGSVTSQRVKRYLVECGGEIVLVCQFYQTRNDTLRTCGFETYRLDLCQMTWDKLERLGDWVLFVGKCCSRSFPAKQLGNGMTNCICFTHNGPVTCFNEWAASYRGMIESGVPDWGIFNLENKKISCRGRPKFWASVWFTVPLRWYFRDIIKC